MLQGQNWNIIRNGRGYGLETTGEINLFNKEQESASAWYTAADFRARLRFPRTADEPPRRLGSCGVHPFRFSRRSLRPALQSTARSN